MRAFLMINYLLVGWLVLTAPFANAGPRGLDG